MEQTEPRTILALDVSTTSTGYAVYVNDELRNYGTISHKSKDWIERVRFMADVIRNMDKLSPITHLVVEDTYVSKNVNTVKKLCFAQGILLGSLPNAKLVQVYPTSWKAHFGLTKKNVGRTTQKDTSMTIAEALTLQSIKNDDEADAVLLGKYVVDNAEDLL